MALQAKMKSCRSSSNSSTVRFPAQNLAMWNMETIKIETFDGVSYELSAAGDYVLTLSADGSVMVQARLGRGANVDWAVTNVAVVLTDYPVEIGTDGSLKIDGRSEELATGSFIPLIDEAAIFRDRDTYTLAWPGEGDSRFRLDVTVTEDELRLTPFLPPEMAGSVAGLLGDGDGEDANDLMSRGGTQFVITSASREAPTEFVQSWAVAPEESLFGCEPGEYTSRTKADEGSANC